MINNILNIFKNKPIEVIFRISSLLTAFIIFNYIIKNDSSPFYFVIVLSSILIYSLYARVKLDYEKVYTKVDFFKSKLSVVNGHLIIKSLYFIIISLITILYNSNPYQIVKIDPLLVIYSNIMAFCLLIFVKISKIKNHS